MVDRNIRSQQEQELLDKAYKYLPGGSLGNTVAKGPMAFVIRNGHGSKVYDYSGNEYIDYLLGSGPMILGHSHPSVTDAVRDYLERGSSYYHINGPAIELAEEICRAVPCAEKIRFTTSGTDATFQCLRVARAYTRRDKILKFEGAYHGTHDYAQMSVSPRDLRDFPHAIPSSAGIPKAIEDLVLMAPFNDLQTTTSIIDRHHDEMAAVIVEPLQRIIPPVPGFLEGIREITAHYNIPLIFDEVVTGFRLAYGGAQEFYGVIPDLCAIGKIVGGGMPLAAVCGREELMEPYDPSLEGTPEHIPQIGTLSGNPLAAVAGLATLKELRKPGTYNHLRDIGHSLRDTLTQAMGNAGIPAQVIGEDCMFDVLFTKSAISDYRGTLTNNKNSLDKFNAVLLENGVLKGVQKFYVSLAHTEADAEQTRRAINIAVEAIGS